MKKLLLLITILTVPTLSHAAQQAANPNFLGIPQTRITQIRQDARRATADTSKDKQKPPAQRVHKNKLPAQLASIQQTTPVDARPTHTPPPTPQTQERPTVNAQLPQEQPDQQTAIPDAAPALTQPIAQTTQQEASDKQDLERYLAELQLTEELEKYLSDKQDLEKYLAELQLQEEMAKKACIDGQCRRCAQAFTDRMYIPKTLSGKKPSEAAYLVAAMNKTNPEKANIEDMRWLKKTIALSAHSAMKKKHYELDYFEHPTVNLTQKQLAYIRHLVTLVSWTIQGHAQSLKLDLCKTHKKDAESVLLQQKVLSIRPRQIIEPKTETQETTSESEPAQANTLNIVVSAPAQTMNIIVSAPQESPKAA